MSCVLMPVRYAPMRFDDARAVEPELAVEVAPGLRPEPQPIRVLHNGRFSLPAGRIGCACAGRPDPPRPAATRRSACRSGASVRPCAVAGDAGAGRDMGPEFWLPVDASFVGFRGTAEVERSNRQSARRANRHHRRRRPHGDPAGAGLGRLRRHRGLLPRRAHVPGAGRLLDYRRAARAVDHRLPGRLQRRSHVARAQRLAAEPAAHRPPADGARRSTWTAKPR